MEDSEKIENLDLALSRRIQWAMTVGKEELFQAAADPSMEVLKATLKNPLLDDNHLLALLKRRDLSAELLNTICNLPMVAESHELKVALVHNPATPPHVILGLLPQLHLFELVDICYLSAVTPDQKAAAERAIIQRLSTTPLGYKITLARRGTAAVVDALMKEGDPRLIDVCLANPHLKEASIFQFLGGVSATPDGISAVARNPRWKGRLNLELAILKNPKTPSIWFTLFLPHIPVSDLKGIIASKRITPEQRKMVKEERKRRGHTTS